MLKLLVFLWRNRASVFLSGLLVLITGWIAFQQLPRSIFPNIVFPRVTVLISAGNLPVKYMLLKITEPLEQRAKNVPGVWKVNSQTGIGLSKLHVYFSQNTPPQTAFLMLQARLAGIHLPPQAKMTIKLMTPHIKPFAQYALVSNQVTSSQMRALFAYNIRPALLSLPGVYRVQGIGRGWPEIQLTLNPRKLAEHQISLSQVLTEMHHLGTYYAGKLNQFHEQFNLITQKRPSSLQALSQLPIARSISASTAAEPPITLSDLGTLAITPPPRMIGSEVAGYRHALLINISAQANTNISSISNRISRRIHSLRQQLPSHIRLVRIYNFSHLVNSSLKSVWIALIIGSLLALAVVYLFLKQLNTAIATILIVPLSLAATFGILKLIGFGMNIMTLGGLAAAIGALMDHAIVIMEQASRSPSLIDSHPLKQRIPQTLTNIAKILPMMTLATVSSLIVFIPLIMLSGTLGLLFRHMALTIVIALITSQIVAITLTPLIAAIIPHSTRIPTPRLKQKSSGFRTFKMVYAKALSHGFKHPWIIWPVIVLLIGIGIGSGLHLPTAFLPQWDEGAIAIPFRTPVGFSVAQTLAVEKRLANAIAQDPDIAHVSGVAGRSLENPRSTPNKGDLVVILKKDRSWSTQKIMSDLRQQIRTMEPNLIELKLHQILINRFQNLSGSQAPLVLYLFGHNMKALHHYGQVLIQKIQKSHQFINSVLKSPSAGPQIIISPDIRASLQNMTPRKLATAVLARQWGVRDGALLFGSQIFPIRVTIRRPHESYQTLQDLSQTEMMNDKDQFFELSHYAHLHIQGSSSFVTHHNLAPYAYILAAPIAGEGLEQAALNLHKIINATHIPTGISATIGGYYRQQRKSFEQMSWILVIALLLLVIAFGFQFSGQRPAITAIIGLALTAPGAFIALNMTHTALDSTAFLGLLLVFSVTVNNMILIFASARTISKGTPSLNAIKHASLRRLKPILMTMIADVLGFLPLALGIGRGTDLLRPLAIGMTGGMILAAVVSLWIVPVLYAQMLKYFPLRTNE